MFDFIQKARDRRIGWKAYEKRLNQIATQGVFASAMKSELNEIKNSSGLRKKDVSALEKKTTSAFVAKLSEDRRLTEDEIGMMNELVNYFGLKPEEFGFDQAAFNRYATLAAIDKGILPEVPVNGNIPLEEGEKVRFACAAVLRKNRTVTTSIRYAGPTVSIRIMKGVRYRAGSAKITRETVNVLAAEDTGYVYITDQKILFNGGKRRISIPLGKVESFDLRPEGIYIHRAGKEIPHILTMDDYKAPAGVLSLLMNPK